jgi:hypothetical protein
LAGDQAEQLEVGVFEPPLARRVDELDGAQDLTLAGVQRHAQDRLRAIPDPLRQRRLVATVVGRIVDQERLTLLGHPAGDPLAHGQAHSLEDLARRPGRGAEVELPGGVLDEQDRARAGADHLHGALEQLVEQLVEIDGRVHLLLDLEQEVQVGGALRQLAVGLLQLEVLLDHRRHAQDRAGAITRTLVDLGVEARVLIGIRDVQDLT